MKRYRKIPTNYIMQFKNPSLTNKVIMINSKIAWTTIRLSEGSWETHVNAGKHSFSRYTGFRAKTVRAIPRSATLITDVQWVINCALTKLRLHGILNMGSTHTNPHTIVLPT
jgi:hypothetical protein